MQDATQALTVICEIRAELRDPLEAILDSIEDATAAAPFRKDRFPDTHFHRFVILDDTQGDRSLPPMLVWESNHDGNAETYLRTIATTVGPGLDAVFGACRGYPAGGAGDVEGWVAWMRRHAHHAAAFYTAYRGVPKPRVDNAHDVHEAIRAVIDARGAHARYATLFAAAGGATGGGDSAVRAQIAADVATANPTLDISSLDGDPYRCWLVTWKAVVVGVLALPILIPLVIVLAPLAYLAWRVLLRRELTDPAPGQASQPVHDTDLNHVDEDFYAQNQLTHLVDIKPGWFRLFTAWLVLTGIDVMARCVYTKGDLGGITSIHFARWVIMVDDREAADIPAGSPRRHRLLFFSNYDGSWESYLGEFVDRASGGLTAVWSNTVMFPRSKGLIGEGSRDEEAFKQWTRDHQIKKYVWWTGVPKSTVQNVRDDLEIRAGLVHPLEPDEAKQWSSKL